jgi:6-phosphogluconolactonase (cycloisomerase 2 family)
MFLLPARSISGEFEYPSDARMTLSSFQELYMKKKAALVACFTTVIALQAAHAQSVSYSHKSDHVYVETNIKTSNGNGIAAFARGNHGELTPIAGSPFLTGGAGTQYAGVNVGPQDSDQDIISNPEHTLLFAVNSGSDTIAVFQIEKNGALSPVPGSPFPSGGNDPVSLSLAGDTLFVVNKSGDLGRPSAILPSYTALRVHSDGSLSYIGETTNDTSREYQARVSVAIGSSPSQAFVIPDTHLLFGTDFLTGLVERFKFDDSGKLHQLSPLALPASEFTDTTTPRLPLGLWNHPYLPLVYVGFVSDNKVGVYEYDLEGSLKFRRAVPNSGAAVCWLRTNRAGTRLYTADTVTNSISVYDLTDPENPVQIQEFNLSGQGNVLQIGLSTDDQSLYALSSRGNAAIPEGHGNELHVLTIQQNGTVAEIQSPVIFNEPNDTRPQGVAVVPGR